MKYYILIITYSFPNQQIQESFPEPSDLQENGRFVFCYSKDDTSEFLRYIPNYQDAFEEQHRHDTAGVLIGQGMPNSIVFMTREGHPKESPQEILADGRSHWRTLGFVSDEPVHCLSDHNSNPHCLLEHEYERVPHCPNCGHCRLEGLIKFLLDHTNNCNSLYANTDTTPWLRLFHGTAHLEHNTQNQLQRQLPRLLSGRLAIFWGLVALNIGENIHELERYFLIHRNHQLCLSAPTAQFDRTSGRAVAVSIYRDPVDNAELKTVEATWQLK